MQKPHASAAHGQLITSDFQPHPWLRNPHLQTLYAQYCRRPAKHAKAELFRLALPDDELIGYDFGSLDSAPRGLVVLFHGLAGCVESNYIQVCVPALQAAGFRVSMMLFRGCGGYINKRPDCYHAGHTDDIAAFLAHWRTTVPYPIHALGFSLGANALLKYLGEYQQNAQCDTAVAVSSPLRLQDGAYRLQRGFSKIYQFYLLRLLKATTKNKLAQGYDMPVTLETLDTLQTLEAFDDKVTAPLHGFCDGKDYYQKNSSRNYLAQITQPTHILHAEDDPFFTPEVVPKAAELSGAITFELAKHGGHVGFIAGRYRPRSWLEQRVSEVIGEQAAALVCSEVGKNAR